FQPQGEQMSEIKVYVVEFGDRNHYQMQYADPLTRRKRTRSTGVERTGRKAERTAAERAAAKWESALREGRYAEPSRILWADFRDRYEAEKLPSLAPRTAEPASAALNHIETHINPHRLADVNAATLSTLQAKLREAGLKETTIAGHLAHLKAALSWAVSVGMLAVMPKVSMPKRAKGQTFMRGRPITAEEFDRMLAKVKVARPADASAWKHYLNGLWLSGLRLGESLLLAWDDGKLAVDLTGKHPRLRIEAEGEKGHKDRLLPMTPDFAEWLLSTPEHDRVGLVFKLPGLLTGKTISQKRVSRIISTIGEKAGVVVNKDEGKFASAHDLRRAFLTRWAPKVKPATLQLLARHETIETTLRYYVAQDADDVAAELWATHKPKGNTLANSGSGAAAEDEKDDARSVDANNG
ncbi:MAG: site-specific integrase, partial [Pirellulales bacterium]